MGTTRPRFALGVGTGCLIRTGAGEKGALGVEVDAVDWDRTRRVRLRGDGQERGGGGGGGRGSTLLGSETGMKEQSRRSSNRLPIRTSSIRRPSRATSVAGHADLTSNSNSRKGVKH